MSVAARLRLLFAICLLLVTGCGAGAQTPHAPPPAPKPLHRGPLTDFVAAAGLRWMVVGRPAELAADPGLEKALSPLIPPVRLAAYARGTGVDLTHTPSALVAGFDYATLYMAETPGENLAVQQDFVARLVSGPVETTPHADLHFIQGVVGQTPETMVRIAGQLVAVSVGDPTPARVVEAYARGLLKRSPTALGGAALSTLPPDLGKAPLAFYAPGPFGHEWVGGAHGLLDAALAVAITAKPLPGGRLEADVVMSGDWGPDSTRRLMATWKDLAGSSTGKLLGFDAPASAPVVSTTRKLLELRVELELVPLVEGLHAAVEADVQDMLDIPPAVPSGRPPRKP